MQQEPHLDDMFSESGGGTATVNVGDYLRRAWRRKFVIIVPALLALMAAVAYTSTDLKISSKRYKSKAKLLEKVPQAAVELLNEDVRKFTKTERDTFYATVNRLKNEVANNPEMTALWEEEKLINPKRPLPLLTRIGIKLRLQEKPTPQEIYGAQVAYLADSLEVEPSDVSRIFTISFECRDRRIAKEVVDLATKLIGKSYQTEVSQLAQQSQKLLIDSKETLQEQLNEVQNLIVDFQLANPGVDPNTIENYNKRYEAELELYLDLESKRLELETSLKTNAVRISAETKYKKGEDPLQELEDALEKLKDELSDLLARKLTNMHPTVQAARTKIRLKEAEIKRKRDKEKLDRKAKRPKETAASAREKAFKRILELLWAERRFLDAEKRRLHQERYNNRIQVRTDASISESTKKSLKERAKVLDAELAKIDARIRKKLNVFNALKPGDDLKAVRMKYSDTRIPHITFDTLPKEGEGKSRNLTEGPALVEEYEPEEVKRFSKDYLDLLLERKKLISLANGAMRSIDLSNRRLRKLEDVFERYSFKAVELEKLRKEQEDLSTRIKFIDDKLVAISVKIQLEKAQYGRQMKVLQRANLPSSPSWPPPWYLILPAALLAGVGVGVFILVSIELLDHSFWRSTAVESRLGVPVLATVPHTNVNTDRNPAEGILFRTTLQDESLLATRGKKGGFSRRFLKRIRRRTVAAEQFRKLRLKLTSGHAAGKAPRTVLVTSSIPEEGKTSIAANLAAAISHRIGEHVLLVDCDLRRPTLHTYFGLQNERGLAEYLRGDAELSDLLLKTDFDRLTVLPAGQMPTNPAELLGSQRMKNLVKEMKARYADRTIIFDSSPVLATAEPNVIASEVDGVLFVVEAGRTPQEIVERALGSMEDDNILGIVLNAALYEISAYFYPKYVA